MIDIENYPLDNESTLLNKIKIYVEGTEDVYFWTDIFDTFAPELKFIFYSYTREEKNGKLKSGKTNVLTEQNIQNACTNQILCVDSDLEYLLKNEPLYSHPYIFHTYSYSIENYKISPYALERIVEKTPYHYYVYRFSFVNFMQEYSKITYPLLRYILYFEKKKLEHGVAEPIISEKELKSIFCIQSNEISKIEITNLTNIIIDKLKNRVSNLIKKILIKYPEINLNQIDNTLSELNIKAKDTTWYLNGHIMYNCVAKIIMQKVIKEKYDWFKGQEETQILKNKLKEYKNLTKKNHWETLMNNGYTYCLISSNRCPPIQKLKEKVKSYVNNN